MAEKTPEDHVRDGLNFVGDKALFGAFRIVVAPAAFVGERFNHYAPAILFGAATLVATGSLTLAVASPLLAIGAVCKLGAHALKPSAR